MSQALLLTGAPGSGKTTIIRDCLSTSNHSAGGFYTQEIRENGVRLGFEIVTLGGSRATLAHVNIRRPHRIGKYGVDVASLDRVAIPALRQAVQTADIAVVDEIGKMELLSSAFADALMEILSSPSRLLGTIMLQPHPLCDCIKADPKVQVVLVSRTNRQAVSALVSEWLQR